MEPNKLYSTYTQEGFTFSREIITNYCLSLYTKPFVILSGISGTGKTKIAQLFKPYKQEESNQVFLPSNDSDYILVNLTKGILDEDGRGNIKSTYISTLLSDQEYQEFVKEREKLLKKGVLESDL